MEPVPLVIKWNAKTVIQHSSRKCMGEATSRQVSAINMILSFKGLPIITTKMLPNLLHSWYRSLWNQALQLRSMQRIQNQNLVFPPLVSNHIIMAIPSTNQNEWGCPSAKSKWGYQRARHFLILGEWWRNKWMGRQGPNLLSTNSPNMGSLCPRTDTGGCQYAKPLMPPCLRQIDINQPGSVQTSQESKVLI